MKKRILLTGVAGAVGFETLKELIKRKDKYEIIAFAKNNKTHRNKMKKFNSEIQIVYGDIRNKSITDKLVKNIDFVIHLAAVIPPLADKFPELAEEVNYGGTLNLIKSLEEKSPNAFFLFTSSVAIYGDRIKNPLINVNDSLNPSVGDAYAVTKINTEQVLKKSLLNWSIFRLTAIMHPKQKFDPLMFHMPLDTKMEICTTKDTAYALVQSIEKQKEINKQIFNLSGGEKCRVTYRDFLSTSFYNSGLGRIPFPESAFAKANFHCGYFEDSDKLNEILDFRKDTLEDFYKGFKKELGSIKILLAKIFRPFIIQYLLSKSDPIKAVKENDEVMIERFFPKENPMVN